ncbi:mastermind-like protein 3 isoform X2 [Engystomops pustulosus]|uniref:mastermind-like protein 3 isoform X2 n=1 Tax=Engystomops pustulosus TaxID=76066 RepID=UPI003AFAB459
MGDFAAPAASTNGSSVCMSSALGSSIGGVASHSANNTPPSAAAPNAPNNSSGGSVSIPKHSTVVERLRQRIEGCRRHHVNCESRYQQAQAEQLEMERRDTVNLYQRTLDQRAKKSGTSQGAPPATGSTTTTAAVAAGGGSGASKQPHHHHHHPPQQQGKQDAETAEHRNHTLIMLQEAVQKKLEGARSPLNGEQQNGICDGRFSPSAKRRRKDMAGMDTHNISNMPLPSVSPLDQLDMKPHLPVTNNVIHTGGLEDINKNGGQQEVKLAVNGSNATELEENFNILNKEMKQEPLDDASVIDTSDTSLSNQNKLFSDINLNDQEWQELIDELANTVPEDDIQDLFNEDFEEKKELDFSRPTAQTPLPQESASVKSDPSHSPFPHVSMGSPQVRPSSSGPSFSNVSSVSSIPSVSSAPSTLMLAGSPASCVVQSPQTPNPPHTPGQTSTRPGNGYVMTPTSSSGSGTVNLPSADLSPAEQLKQMAAQQQQRAKLIQKQQHPQQQPPQQQPHTNQPSSWSPVGPPSSPYGGAFGTEKPNSPMMYPQTFNNQNSIVPPMANNPPKTTMNNYLPQSHMNMINQQPSNLNSNSISKTPNMLNYGNTKPLSHYNADMSQRMTPPIANQNKNAMLPYMQQQQQPPMPPQMSHLSEEQKRLLLMKQKGLMNQQMAYGSLPGHSQEQNTVGMSRPAGPMQQSVPGAGGNPGASGFMPSQPQAAMMKQMLIEQRAQLHAMEQQKQQFLREQRQQQQQQLLAEQLQQPHMNRQHLQQQRNPYGVQQVNPFQGSPQDIAVARNQAALQNMRASRMMAQNTSMLSMGPSQNPGTMPTGPLQPEMGMAPYSNASSGQPGMYSMNTGINQMMQHPNQNSINMAHSAVQGPRQPTSGQAMGMVGGFSQNMLVNSVMPQQHQQMKGPVGQPINRAQAPRLQNMMTSIPQGAQTWPQRGLQGMRTSGEMGAYNNGSGYPMQPGQSRMSKQHFQQGLSQSVVDSTGTVRALNPAMSRQMMQSLPGQQGATQPRQMMPTMNPGVPSMAGFTQAQTQQLPGGNFVPSNQGQVYDRNPGQDMSYSYTDANAGPFSGLADGTDLVDSIMGRGPGDEWMQELDELFGNQS